MDTEALAEGTLRSYLHILYNRKWSVLIVMALTLTGAFLYTHREPTVYEASAELYLAPTPTEMVIGGGSFAFNQPSVPDQIEVLQGNGVAGFVKKQLGYVPGITGGEVGQTDVMLATARAPNALQASRIANAYADAYLKYEQGSVTANLESSNKSIEARLLTVQQQLAGLEGQLATATKNGDTTQESSLQAQVNSLQSEQSVLTQEVTQLSQATQLNAAAAQVIATATPPAAPIQPNLRRNLLFGLVAGLVIGIALVVAREYFDDTIRSEEELHVSLARSEKTSKVLVLGAIPYGEEVFPGMAVRGVVSITDPTSPQAEAYRELRTSLQFLQVHEPIEVVLVSSPSGGEGKSTTLANLGVMLAKTGKSIVMVSCDLRRPRLHEYFGLSNSAGFTSVLVGDCSLADALQPVPEAEGLTLLSAGPLPPNPAELLSGPAAEVLIGRLKESFDVVLVDSPPVLRVTDAAVLSTLSDTSILVVRAGLTNRRDLVKSLDNFDRIGSPVAGVVVNALPTELTYKDRYYYSAQESVAFGLDTTVSRANGNENGGPGDHEVVAVSSRDRLDESSGPRDGGSASPVPARPRADQAPDKGQLASARPSSGVRRPTPASRSGTGRGRAPTEPPRRPPPRKGGIGGFLRGSPKKRPPGN